MANSRIQVPPFRELEQMAQEIFLNETDKVTKVSPQSVLKGFTSAQGKLAQKVIVEASVIEAVLFPDSSSGDLLDDILSRQGLPARFGETKASTYVRLVGDVGTVYTAGVNNFTGKDGVVFELLSDVNIGDAGFTYAYVQATTVGSEGNVDALTLNTITPSEPVGHNYVVNEYKATGGQDEETDDQVRYRIKNSLNILAKGTLAKYEQVLQREDTSNRFFKLYLRGLNATTSALKFDLATVNGGSYTNNELKSLESAIQPYLEWSDQIRGVEFSNVTYFPIDISFRAELNSNVGADETRNRLQVEMGKLLNPLFYNDIQRKVEWDDFLVVAKRDRGVNKVFDQFFTPSTDINVPINQLPRIRGFIIYDVGGSIITDTTGVLNDTFYPASQDLIFQQTT